MSKNNHVKSSAFLRDPVIGFFSIGSESAELMGTQFEVFADHTCGIPLLPIEGNLFYVNLSHVIRLRHNKWAAQLVFAQYCAAHGIRAFPDVDGVALATPLNNDEFATIIPKIVSEIPKELWVGNDDDYSEEWNAGD